MIRWVFILVFCGGLGEGVNISDDRGMNCSGKYRGIGSRDELFDELLPRVLSPVDSSDDVQIKRVFLHYLTKTPVFLSLMSCNASDDGSPVPRQEDEDDDDGGGGGGAGVGGAGGANPLDNTNVVDGVRRILANVFTGNLIGIIQESVGLRSPEGVTTVFTDVLSTLFGSMATAGVTGILGNITTTPVPNNSSTLPPGYEAYIMQHYAQQQQQQLLLAQQQQLGGGQIGGVQQQVGQVGQQPQQLGSGIATQQIASPVSQQQYLSQNQYLQQQYVQQQKIPTYSGGLRPANTRPVRQRVTKPPQEADDYEDDD